MILPHAKIEGKPDNTTVTAVDDYLRCVPKKYRKGPVKITVRLNADGCSDEFVFRNRTVFVKVVGWRGATP